ncbi:iron complex outermembrane recepter protein [Pseudomonas flavescens]|uniref:Iron complex outermembrane recepter protein n=1 Tax=Phytopseudomonas flavescens TaxID=29435 RepID=A0A1G8PK78_9GAMM|nr:TonB-dependent receptor [Pseudomonas flavescens]SDI92894.1 iron complex outermembrane recepter protein [Pseudomonas flavescens]
MQPISFHRHSLAVLSLSVALGMGVQSDKIQAQSSVTTDNQQLQFDVPAGSLDQVLLGISRQAGQLISFQQSLVQGRSSPAIRGALSVEQAIERALQDSDLRVRHGERGWSVEASAVTPNSANVAATDTALARVVVTGSNIRRAEAEGSSPVQVIDAEQIEKSGKSTLPELLRSISANSGQSFNEQFTSSFSTGSSGVALRGLSQKNTLILVNGRRLANYGFAQNLQDTFVNLNSLPKSMVERIEVLKDGASAVYGSDAIAGVINIITRQDIQGLTVGGDLGTSDEGGAGSQSFKVLGGAGDFVDDGYNFSFTFDGYQRDQLNADDRHQTRSGNFSNRPGGGAYDGWGIAGRFIRQGPQGQYTEALPTCPFGSSRVENAALGSTTPGSSCAFNGQSYKTLFPETERYQSYFSGRVQLANDVEAFGEAIYTESRNASIFGAPYSVTSNTTVYDPETGGLVPAYSNVLPVGHPSNPYGEDVQIQYNLGDLGRRDKVNKNRFFRGLAGLRGDWHAWEWETTAYQTVSRERENTKNFLSAWGLREVLADGSYNFLEPSQNSAATIDKLRIGTERQARSSTSAVDLKMVNAEFFDLPAGPVGFAWGSEARRERIRSETPDEILSGEQVSPAIADIDGARTVKAVYGEFNIPLLDNLEVDIAGRTDWYSDFGRAFSPKYGIRWQVAPELLVRGAFSRGFRAPSLPEVADSTSVAYGGVVDARDPDRPGAVVSPTRIIAGNPDLQPERSKNVNLGVVISPTPLTSLSVDYYHIKQRNVIDTNSNQWVVDNEDSHPQDVIRDERGKLVTIYNRFQNLSNLVTDGFDLELNQRIPTAGYGDFSVNGNWTYVRNWRWQPAAGQPLQDAAGSNYPYAFPKWKGTTALTWAYGDWSNTLTWYYTGGYKQAYQSDYPGSKGRIEAYNQFDWTLRYGGFKDLTLFASINNLENKTPPYDPVYSTTYSDYTQYDLLGRYFKAGFEYRFF